MSDEDTTISLLQRIQALEMRIGRTEAMETLISQPGYVTTTDATVTTLATIAIPASTTVKVSVFVAARRTAGGGTAEDAAGYQIDATYKNVAGVATLVGALTLTYTAESVAGYDATLTPNAGNVLVRVTGVVATSISWVCVANLLMISS